MSEPNTWQDEFVVDDQLDRFRGPQYHESIVPPSASLPDISVTTITTTTTNGPTDFVGTASRQEQLQEGKLEQLQQQHQHQQHTHNSNPFLVHQHHHQPHEYYHNPYPQIDYNYNPPNSSTSDIEQVEVIGEPEKEKEKKEEAEREEEEEVKVRANSYHNTTTPDTVESTSITLNPSTSFFPELSLSPSPEPESNLNPKQGTRSRSTSFTSNFDSSLASSPALQPQHHVDSEQHNFSVPGFPLLAPQPHTSYQAKPPQQLTSTTQKRKRGRPPKNSFPQTIRRTHPFATFNNGFAMTFTSEDDYRIVDENEFESDGVPSQPVQEAIALDPKKRAEKQRASTAAASREKRQVKPPTESTSTKEPIGRSRSTAARSDRSSEATTLATSGRTPRAKRGGDKAAPKYNVTYSDEDEDETDDDDDDDKDHDHDEFSGPSNSSSEEDDEEEEDKSPDAQTPKEELPERSNAGGRSLRARGKLSQPDRLKEYVSVDSALRRGTGKKKNAKKTETKGQHQTKFKRLGKGLSCQHCHNKRIRCDGRKPKCGSCIKYKCDCIPRIWVNGRAAVQPQGDNADAEVDIVTGRGNTRDKTITTQRQDMRLAIQEGATKKRHNFFRAYEHLFLPLLPEKNFISKLKEIEEKEQKEKELKEQEQKEKEQKEKGQEEKEREEKEQEEKAELSKEIKDGENDVNMEESIQKTLTEETDTATKEALHEEKKHEAVPYKLLDKQPPGVTAIMKPYQIAGLSFLVWLYNNGVSGLLGDEMGLGKTLQTLSLFSYLTEHHPSPPGQHRPFLVVCPLSVLSSWMNECKRWTPHLRAMRFHGQSLEKQRLKKLAELGELDDDGVTVHPYDVIVTTYDVYEREVSWFRRAFVWRYVVLDEGHKIKNEMTQISQALQGLSAEYRLVLTGTPLQNNLKELWALLHFLLPEVFILNTQVKFTNAFNLTLGKVDKAVMDDSRKLLELLMLRRMKDSKGVNLGLPPKREVVLALPLTPMQRFWYKRLLTRLDKGLLEDLFKGAKNKEEEALQEERRMLKEEEDQLEKLEEGLESENPETQEDSWREAKTIMEQSMKQKTTAWQKLMNLLMQLRKCCNHPYLLPGAAPEPYFSGTHIMLASSKFIILDRLIDELCIKQGRKVLIFSGFTKMLDLVEEFLSLKGGDGEKFHYSRLDGGTCRARRNLEIRLFNADDRYKVMLLSTRAGGLGINLATASDVVMLESDWNPQADLQAQARAHRIGQTNEVTVYRLITQGTVEEQMMGRIRKKLYLSAKVTESMRDIHSTDDATSGKKGRGRPKMSEEGEEMPNFTAGQLMSLVRRGAQAIAKPEVNPEDMLKWNWEEMVDKTKDYDMTLEPNDQQGKKKAVEGQAGEKKNIEVLDPGVAVVVEEEDVEIKWLSEMERVETRLFEGREHKKREEEEHAQLILDITRNSRREGKNRVVMVDGHAVLKETVGCGEWEAVRTISGKGDTIFSEPQKRKKAQFEHQDFCQICFDGGTLSLCHGCPRSYHIQCLPQSYKPQAKQSVLGGFHCPQHQCALCDQKTTNAGGMLFRCRWCENSYCEDCMDWDETKLIGDYLVEMDLLDYGERSNAYWIKCVECIAQHKENPKYEKMCDDMEKGWEAEMAKMRKKEELRLTEVEAEKGGVETPVSAGGLGESLQSTGATTTAATSIGSDGGDVEENSTPSVVILDDTDSATAPLSRTPSQAPSSSSRISRRIAANPNTITYSTKKSATRVPKTPNTPSGNQQQKYAEQQKEGEGEEEDVDVTPSVTKTLPIAAKKRKEAIDAVQGGFVFKKRR